MKKLIGFFITNSVLVNLLIVLIIIFGIMSASRLTSSFFPEQSTKFIFVEAVYPGASPEEIEKGITLKVEDNLEGISGIDRVTSTSSENSALIQIELLPKADANEVLQEVRNAVDRISSFPEQMERITTYKQEMVNFTAKVALSGAVPLRALKETAKKVEDDFRDFKELSKIELSGFTLEEIEIEILENKLRAYGITFQEVSDAVRQNNINITGGTIRGDRREVIIRAKNRDYFASGFEDIVVRSSSDGSLIRLSDLAEVKNTWSEDTDRAIFSDEPAVIITVNTTNRENILEAAAFIRDYIEKFNQENSVIKATMVRDYTESLRERIALLEKNGIMGAVLVMIILTLFLRFRLAWWVALGIPISFLGMFIFAGFYGLTINVLSLFGMILVLGILVDDGVIVGENIFQHHEDGESNTNAAINGTIEVFPSVLAAISTTAVAFSVFFLIIGQLGEFFSDVSFVVIASLVVSLIEVMLFLPAHLAHSKDLKKNYKAPKWKRKISDFLLLVRDKSYKPFLEFVTKNTIFYLFIILALFVITFSAVTGGVIRTAFFPQIEDNVILATLEMPAGTPDSITQLKITQVQEAAFRLNDKYKEELGIDTSMIKNVELIIGPTKNKATANIYLLSAEAREIESFRISSDLRKMVGGIAGANRFSITTESPFGKPVSISLTSSDFKELRRAKDELKQELESWDELTDIIDTDRENQPEVNITLNENGKLLGLDLMMIAQQVRNGFFGREAQRLQRGEDEVKVWVRYQIKDRKDIESLKRMRITTPNGGSYPLETVANITEQEGLISINHRAGKREISVEAEMANQEASAPEQIERIRTEVMPKIQAKYPGINYLFEGQVRETRKLQESLNRSGPAILLLMLGVIIFTFRSFSQGIVLVLLIPFGVIGAVWGHFIHSIPISILSMLGFVALIGILLNDGLVFVNAFNRELGKGKDFHKALINTGVSRFRPIVLTTLTTAGGLGPLIFEESLQAQFLIPMAVTVAYGLLIGSFLLATVLPVFLIISNRVKLNAVQFWTGEKYDPEWMERSYRKGHRVRTKKEEDE